MSALSGKAEKAAEKAQKVGEGKAAAKSKTEKTQKVGEGRAGVAFNPEIKAAPTGCTNAVCGVVTSVEALEKLVAKKKQFLVAVDVGEEELVKVATLLAVAEGQRVVVALEGSFVGESAVVVKDVGGHVTTGRLCDTAMLGWEKGSSKVLAVLPATFAIGDAAPEEAPTKSQAKVQEVDSLGNAVGSLDLAEELSAKPKLSKEDKKIAALEAKAAREAKKLAAKGGGGGGAAGGEEGGAAAGPRKANKLELAKLKKEMKARRSAGEEVYTDDELEAAGFLVE